MDTMTQSRSNSAQDGAESQGISLFTSDDLKKNQEKLQELAGLLSASVVSPLDETMDALAAAWREDAAGAAFLARLMAHRENILAAREQLEAATRELNDYPA